ncbi:MAG: alpha/beta hydrolase [Phycisphaerae bacterium]|nr:alpha/beta hydrolase [Phycisphaerae bacterium]
MTQLRINHTNHRPGASKAFLLLTVFLATLSFAASLQAGDLPPELPLWKKPPKGANRIDIKEKVRAHKAPGSPTGWNRAFSSVSVPAYSIHRPKNPNGVGVVICPGGGFRDIWIDREGHDLAIWLKKHGITSLVLKYRTRPKDLSAPNAWTNYQKAVRSDARRAIRILRSGASKFGLKTDKIGICGFSAGGHLALSTALHADPERGDQVNGMPNFAGLFYPGIPKDAAETLAGRTASGVCPMFIVNARVDRLTPAEKCVDFYAKLLKAGVNAELHIFSKGSHGFGMGSGAGKSKALWTTNFIAWLSDSGMIPKQGNIE